MTERPDLPLSETDTQNLERFGELKGELRRRQSEPDDAPEVAFVPNTLLSETDE